MTGSIEIPIGIKLSHDIEILETRKGGKPFRARLRWPDPTTKERRSKSESFSTRELAQEWTDRMLRLSERGIDPVRANTSLAGYGEANMALALKPGFRRWCGRIVGGLVV